MSIESSTKHWCHELYEVHAAEVLLYGRALGLSPSEAEDVMHDVFVALLKMPTAPVNARHYMLRAFRNRCLNFKRGLFRRLVREVESLDWFERTQSEDDLELFAVQELEKLPTDQREVIVLRIWHGLSNEEIGKLLETSPNTVAGRYRYGMGKLRDKLRLTTYETTSIGAIGRAIEVLETA